MEDAKQLVVSVFMPSHATREAHAYAERIRERLPRKLQDAREAAKLSMYALWQKCGVSRDMISRIEGGESIPGVHELARMATTTSSRCRI